MVREFAAKYFDEMKQVLDRIELDKLERVVDLLVETVQHDRQVFVFGNGGSAAASSHFLCDLAKTAAVPGAKKFRVICLNDNVPVMTAWANDVGYEQVFVGQLRNYLNEGDVVIAVSGSGNSPNILRAVEYAIEKKAHTVGISGFDGGKLKGLAEVSLIAHVDDMQHAEDVQTVLMHVMTRVLQMKLRAAGA
ncbi:MAG: SIS domain-containing protein [Deltaproteobacteria bacterium]|nr:SIS domain-containing protein [Deltaproteobacteria bacterium]